MATKLLKPILIINRENGQVERVVETKEQYDQEYEYFTRMNDVATAIQVFCDFTNQTVGELLLDFNLVELINCFSTRYQAQVTKPRTKKK